MPLRSVALCCSIYLGASYCSLSLSLLLFLFFSLLPASPPFPFCFPLSSFPCSLLVLFGAGFLVLSPPFGFSGVFVSSLSLLLVPIAIIGWLDAPAYACACFTNGLGLPCSRLVLFFFFFPLFLLFSLLSFFPFSFFSCLFLFSAPLFPSSSLARCPLSSCCWCWSPRRCLAQLLPSSVLRWHPEGMVSSIDPA